MTFPILAHFLTPPGSSDAVELAAFHPDGIAAYEIKAGIIPKWRVVRMVRPDWLGGPPRAILGNANGRKLEVRVHAGDGGTWESIYDGDFQWEGGHAEVTQARQHLLIRNAKIFRPIDAVTPWGNAQFDVWFDNCYFVGRGTADGIDGWAPGFRRVYFTHCDASETQNAFGGNNVHLARGCAARLIGSDAFSDALCVWNCYAHEQGGAETHLHPDVYQFRGNGPLVTPKVIAGLFCRSPKRTQGIFADASTPVRNAAIVGCYVRATSAGLSLEGPVSENVFIERSYFDPTNGVSHPDQVVMR